MTRFSIFETEAGWVGVAFSENGLCRLVLPGEDPNMIREELLADSHGTWLETADNSYEQEICRYFAGERVALDYTVDWSWATPFQREVLEVVKKIPYGKTESYGSVASLAGSPRAFRAVGGALGRNRVPLVIPCHRVLAAGTKIGGFSSRNGLRDKRALLSLESIKHV